MFYSRQKGMQLGVVLVDQPNITSGQDVDSIFDRYRQAYPSIEFEVDWANSAVNSYPVVVDGQMIVILLGGMAKTYTKDLIALMVAHEIAHLVGAGDKSTISKMLCEGHADYQATRVIMRAAWGQDYDSTVQAAIAEFARVNDVPNTKHAPGGHMNCETHPGDDCRVATMHAGVDGNPIPGCATEPTEIA